MSKRGAHISRSKRLRDNPRLYRSWSRSLTDAADATREPVKPRAMPYCPYCGWQACTPRCPTRRPKL